MLKADVGDVDQIRTMFADLAEAFGGLDILVNNAGIFPRATALDLDEAIWDRVHDVNLKGTFFCTQEAARLMIPRGSGRIVNIASDAAIFPAVRGSHYNASKAGVLALTKSLPLSSPRITSPSMRLPRLDGHSPAALRHDRGGNRR